MQLFNSMSARIFPTKGVALALPHWKMGTRMGKMVCASALSRYGIMKPASLAHSRKGHLSESRYAFDIDRRQRTAVLNVSSDLWQLDVYTWQARQIFVTESCLPVMPWDG